jgi:hypothetical protein
MFVWDFDHRVTPGVSMLAGSRHEGKTRTTPYLQRPCSCAFHCIKVIIVVTRGVVNGAAFSPSSAQLAHLCAGALKLRLTLQPLGYSQLCNLCHRKLPRLGNSR